MKTANSNQTYFKSRFVLVSMFWILNESVFAKTKNSWWKATWRSTLASLTLAMWALCQNYLELAHKTWRLRARFLGCSCSKSSTCNIPTTNSALPTLPHYALYYWLHSKAGSIIPKSRGGGGSSRCNSQQLPLDENKENMNPDEAKSNTKRANSGSGGGAKLPAAARDKLKEMDLERKAIKAMGKWDSGPHIAKNLCTSCIILITDSHTHTRSQLRN